MATAQPELRRRLSVASEGHRIRWRRLLEEWPVAEIEMRPPVTLDVNLSVEDGLRILLDQNVRAAPVQDGSTWVGVFDLREAIKYAIQEYDENHPSEDQGVIERAMDFFARSITDSTKNLRYFSVTRPFRCVSVTTNVMEVATLLSSGSHIVGVNDEAGALRGVLTQGTLFRLLCDRWQIEDQLLPLSRMAELGLVTSPVRSIPTTMPAHEAFREMAKYNLSGLAVVDVTGSIQYNTSATDIKLWLQNEASLRMTIEEFLIKIRQQDIMTRFPASTCTMETTLAHAVGTLKATKYHRLWVVNDARQPIGVLALTDIFRFLTAESLLNE